METASFHFHPKGDAKTAAFYDSLAGLLQKNQLPRLYPPAVGRQTKPVSSLLAKRSKQTLVCLPTPAALRNVVFVVVVFGGLLLTPFSSIKLLKDPPPEDDDS